MSSNDDEERRYIDSSKWSPLLHLRFQVMTQRLLEAFAPDVAPRDYGRLAKIVGSISHAPTGQHVVRWDGNLYRYGVKACTTVPWVSVNKSGRGDEIYTLREFLEEP